MNQADLKYLRAAARKRAMQDAAARATWSGGRRAIPNKKAAADKRACREWRSE